MIEWTQEKMGELEIKENCVWTQVPGAPRHTPMAAVLQAEGGTSSVTARDMKTKVTCMKHIMDGESDRQRPIFGEMKGNRLHYKWLDTIEKYTKDIDTQQLSQLKNMNTEEIKKKVNALQTTR